MLKHLKSTNAKIVVITDGGNVAYAYDGDIPTFEAISVMNEEYGIDMSSHRATAIRNSNIECILLRID